MNAYRSLFGILFIVTDKNQYVHRRDSVSLATLPEREIQQRMKLGLVTSSPHQHEVDDDDDDDDDDGSDIDGVPLD